MGTMVEVQDLFVKYAGNQELAIKGLSLEVEQGEFLAVVGPADAGKSTLCRCLSGLIPHSYEVGISGTVRVCGHDVLKTGVADLSRYLRYVFEEPASQLIGMSVEEELAFALETMGLDRDEMERRVAWALEAVRLTPYRYKSPTELSGGQMQRVAIASALASRPQVLVLDEPTAELDPVGKSDVFEIIARLSRETSLTIILVDQHSEEIIKYADRVMLLVDGRCERVAAPREFFSDVPYLEKQGVGVPQVVTLGKELCEQVTQVPLPFSLNAAQELVEELLGPQGRFPAASRSGRLETGAEPTGKPVLEVRDLRFQYPDGTPALKGVNFQVARGEFLAIIGENGAGKTTLIKHLNGLLTPTGGEVLVKGRPAVSYSTGEMASTVGFVFQNPDHQICCQTVEDEIAFGLKLLDYDPGSIRRRVEEILDAFALTRFRRLHPYFLSKADRQRLAAAAVIAMEPELLVVDEPTTGFDFSEANRFMAMLQSLNEKGQTVVVITHEMELVARYVPRTILMADGRVLLDAPTREVFARQELLRQGYVKPPQMAELAWRLRHRGCPPLLLPEELVAVLKQALDEKPQPVKAG